jgi:hypothetical protein
MAKNKKRVCGECPECKLGPKNFCFWQMDHAVPEHFKPSLIKAFVSLEDVDGFGYLQASEIEDNPFDPEFLSWFLAFCVRNKLNVYWKTRNIPFCLGSTEFIETLTRSVNDKVDQNEKS